MRSVGLPELLLAACMLLFASLVPAPSCAAETGVEREADKRTVRIAVLAHRGDEPAIVRWSGTADYLSQALGSGLRFEVVPVSLQGMRTSLESGEAQFVLTNPGHFARISHAFRLSPIATVRRDRKGQPQTGNRFGSVIFVRSDNASVRTLVDLKNKSFAAVAPDAFGGFLVAAFTLISHGVDPWKDIGAIEYVGFPHDRIVEAVIEGTADAGTVRTGVIESMIDAGRIRGDEVRVLNPQHIPGFDFQLSTAVFPEWTLAAVPDVPEKLRRDVALALLSMDEENKAAVSGGYGGWTTVMYNGQVQAVLDATAPGLAAGDVKPASNVWLAVLMACGTAGLLLLWRWKDPAPQTSVPAEAESENGLTRRECEILKLVCSGLTTKEIARRLGISPKTVEFHRGNLMRKYEAQNMAELASKAVLENTPGDALRH